MALNLCHPAFKSEITCDKPTVDGHEADNLISKSFIPSSFGFMTESFVRPPVILLIAFPIHIELHSLVMYTKVGSQASAGFEIWTSCETLGKDGLSNEVELKPKCSVRFSEQNFMQISKGCDLSKQFFLFENASFVPRHPYEELKRMPQRHIPTGDQIAQRNMRFRGPGWLTHVSHLAIKIFMNKPGSTCAIKWLEVWGQPSRISTQPLQKKILSVYNAITSRPPSLEKAGVQQTSDKSGVTEAINQVPASDLRLVIPDDFLDPIVCEIMALPVLLPSGNTIDQSTLDRHVSEEARWGRAANDPFTGIPFSDRNKPVPNAALKSRIDFFLLKNGANMGNIRRTVGSVEHSSSTVSRLVADSKRNTRTDVKPCTHVSKPIVSITGMCKRSLKKRSSSPPLERNAKLKCRQLDKSGSVENLSHSERLKRSLDKDVSSALGNLPSFIRFSTPRASKTSDTTNDSGKPNTASCFICEKKDVSAQYLLKCNHTSCRTCLFRIKSIVQNKDTVFSCPSCKVSTLSKDIVKLHK